MVKDKETSDLIGQRKIRLDKVKTLRELGIDPYPAKSNKEYSNSYVLEKFDELEGKTVTLAGRLMSWREHGKLVFGDLVDASAKIQIYIKEDEISNTNPKEEILGFNDLNLVDIGDIVEVTGKLTKTQRGEKSILVKKLRMLVKTLRPLPTNLEDKEERFRRRYVDMQVHPEVRERFERRAEFWQAHREFFNSRGFFEVNIPVLEHVPGGGDAVPFTTHMNAIDQDFFLRISHELPLKRLIGGGFEKVYDIGARFRNEGLSDEHLPEHVAMEFYWAYADWKDGMEFIQELYNYILKRVYGDKKIFKIREFEVNFSKKWETIDFNQIMQKTYGIKDVYTITLEEVKKLLTENNIKFDRSINIARGVDSLWKRVRKTISGPAFLINHPKYLSPLQKPSVQNPLMVERFQPIIAGSELGNGWSEVNDAVDQYERFAEQQKLRDAGDAEAQWLDIDYVEMLEYGMAPTFGYGHSERVFWFLENITAREGVPFPQLKMDYDNVTKDLYPVLEEIDLHSTKVKVQDKSKKMIIVLDKDLTGWQLTNTVGHLTAYLGAKIKENLTTRDDFKTKDGSINANSQYPVITMSANSSEQLYNLLQKAEDAKLTHLAYTQEMIDFNDDSELQNEYLNKNKSNLKYLGIGIFGDNDTLKQLTNKFSLWK